MESLANPVGVGAHHKGERPTSSVPVRIVRTTMLHGPEAIDHVGTRLHLLQSRPCITHFRRKMIRKPATGEFQPDTRKTHPRGDKRRSPDMFEMRAAAEKHSHEMQRFERNDRSSRGFQ